MDAPENNRLHARTRADRGTATRFLPPHRGRTCSVERALLGEEVRTMWRFYLKTLLEASIFCASMTAILAFVFFVLG